MQFEYSQCLSLQKKFAYGIWGEFFFLFFFIYFFYYDHGFTLTSTNPMGLKFTTGTHLSGLSWLELVTIRRKPKARWPSYPRGWMRRMWIWIVVELLSIQAGHEWARINWAGNFGRCLYSSSLFILKSKMCILILENLSWHVTDWHA